MTFVWVFQGEDGRLASGVFSSRENAEAWIAKHGLSGLLTRYPLDTGAYDWEVESGHFSPRKDDQKSSRFIGRFTGGSVHFHYEDGHNTEDLVRPDVSGVPDDPGVEEHGLPAVPDEDPST